MAQNNLSYRHGFPVWRTLREGAGADFALDMEELWERVKISR
jgi:hypothetical protein